MGNCRGREVHGSGRCEAEVITVVMSTAGGVYERNPTGTYLRKPPSKNRWEKRWRKEAVRKTFHLQGGGI